MYTYTIVYNITILQFTNKNSNKQACVKSTCTKDRQLQFEKRTLITTNFIFLE